MRAQASQITGLVCPACRKPMQETDPNRLRCSGCLAEYPVLDGIPSFVSKDSPPRPVECELSVVLPQWTSADLDRVLPGLRSALASLGVMSEVIAVDGRPGQIASEQGRWPGVRVVTPRLPGYGGALRTGIEEARGGHILSLEPEGWQDSGILTQLWNARDDSEIVIGSRYIPGAGASMPLPRRVLSRTFNRVARRALSVPAHDISSGFRLYARQALAGLELMATDFDVLEEIVIRAVAAGYTVREVPFRYVVRSPANGRVRGVAISTLRTLGSMWKLRNSIASADYDSRAHDSIIPLQRYWQRRRHRVITRASATATCVLDVGCGSSRILEANPSAVGLDIQLHKLRYARRYGNPLVHGSIFALPFADATFDCVICSEVIEHIPSDDRVFDELTRVLRPGGRLILGTPDYDRWRWRALEWVYRKAAPGGYADEHITQYGQASLRDHLEKRGLAVERIEYVAGAEMIFLVRKPAP